MCSVGLILLAAGASTRMGSPKQLLVYEGQSLLFRAAQTALTSVCRPVVVVLGAQARRLALEVSRLPVHVTVNEQWADGMGGSVRAGVLALQAQREQEQREQEQQEPMGAAVIMLCDQPLVTADALNALVAAHSATGSRIVASEYKGTLGVPVLFAGALLPELARLTGEGGAKRVIARYPFEVLGLPLPEGAADIDTPEDRRRLLLPSTTSRWECEGRT